MKRIIIITLTFLWITFFSCFYVPVQISSSVSYNNQINDTSDLIAYVYYQIIDHGPIRNQEIYFVNVKTRKQDRFTYDQFTDSDLSWSPDGNKLLFVSHRNPEIAARYHDNYNYGYLYIYNFLTHKEYSLENNISNEVDSMAALFKQKGHKIEKDEFDYPDSDYPTWLSNEKIGFNRHIYYGHTSGYRELITTDTLGKKLNFKRPLFKNRKGTYFKPYWINEDSIIVNISFSLFSNDSVFLYSSCDDKYYSIKPFDDQSVYDLLVSNDKKYIFYRDSINLFRYNINDEEIILLNQKMKDIDSFIISPNNEKIAFISSAGGNSAFVNQNIFTMNLNGSELKQLTFDGGYKHSMSWSPKNAF